MSGPQNPVRDQMLTNAKQVYDRLQEVVKLMNAMRQQGYILQFALTDNSAGTSLTTFNVLEPVAFDFASPQPVGKMN